MFFICIIAIVMIGYGVASRSMAFYPTINGFTTQSDGFIDTRFDGRSVFRQVFYPVYYLLFGEFRYELDALDSECMHCCSLLCAQLVCVCVCGQVTRMLAGRSLLTCCWRCTWCSWTFCWPICWSRCSGRMVVSSGCECIDVGLCVASDLSKCMRIRKTSGIRKSISSRVNTLRVHRSYRQ